jgi:hypothetical protein
MSVAGRASQLVCASPSQHPSLNLQRGHCHVPCRHSIEALHRKHLSTMEKGYEETRTSRYTAARAAA